MPEAVRRDHPLNAFVVLDLGFGDAGKGLLTDWLVRRTGATLVVRYNGGAQAGHNVVAPDGAHHTFAQLGAGSFVPGVRTFLSRHVIVHPTGLLAEAAAFGRAALDRVFISERALVITPDRQEAGRQRERALGHGTCGIGVGETVRHAIEHPDDAVRAADLRDAATLRRKGCPVAWIEIATRLAPRVVKDDFLSAESGTVVFEGAQGVLLDEWHGFHPHTTWSTCTAANALDLVPGATVTKIGVIRSHMVRHGPGPLPTETPEIRIREHNRANEWQGPVRYGWFDAVLVRYALDVAGGVDLLAVTHLDSIPPKACSAYEGIYRLPVHRSGDLAAAESLTRIVQSARPILRDFRDVESLLDRSVDIRVTGPRAADVSFARSPSPL